MPSQTLATPVPAPALDPSRSAGPAPAVGPGNAARATALPTAGNQVQGQGQGSAAPTAWGGAAGAQTGEAWTPAPSREDVLAGGTLARGHEGPLVAWVQAALVRLGLPVGQTGQYGPTTAGVVTEFQRVWGVGQTGEVGAQTLNTMSKAVTCSISMAEFRAMNPGMPEATARAYLPHLNASMLRANISTDARKAAYLAQLGHESDGFNTLEEYASGAEYEGRSDLGNTQRGDGRRFKGRGPIQITGRANYRSYGQEIGVDLIKQPELASTPGVGFQLAAAYWARNDLNRYADRAEFDTISRRINGGDNGRADRRARWGSAKAVLARTAKSPKVVPAAVPQRSPSAPAPQEEVAPPTAGPVAAGALDAAAAPLTASAWAGAAAAATDFAASPEAKANPSVAAGATQLARAAALLGEASAALQTGDGATTKSKAHEGANILRQLRDQGLLSPAAADQAVQAAGALWRRADQARPNAPAPAPAPQEQPAPAPSTPAGPTTAAALDTVARALQGGKILAQGDEGDAVIALQRLLGMEGEALTGRFGPTTTSVVKAAQSRAGLVADGIVGPATLGALRGTAAASTRSQDLAALGSAIGDRALRLGDSGAAVSALQRLLGMGASGTTGTFGQTTKAVLVRFQRDNGLEADGIAGASTLNALRGGGSTPGQAAGSLDAYRNGKLLGKIKIVRIDGVLMAEGMVPHWVRLRDAASRDGVRLKLNSGFRTMDEQRVLYQGYVAGTRGLAAAPGYSNHQHGEAVDIDVVSDAAYTWMFRNAPRMGWRNTVPSEPWHWEYFWRR